MNECVSACGPGDLSHGRMPSLLCEPAVLTPQKQTKPVTQALNYFKVLAFALSLVGHSAAGVEETSKYQRRCPVCSAPLE